MTDAEFELAKNEEEVLWIRLKEATAQREKALTEWSERSKVVKAEQSRREMRAQIMAEISAENGGEA